MTSQIFLVVVGIVAIAVMAWIMKELLKFLPWLFALILTSPLLIIDASYDLAKKMTHHE